MKILGVLIIVNGLIGTAYWIGSNGSHKGYMIGLCALAVFAGAALVIHERLTELTIEGVGTLKATVKQAEEDANAIAELKKRVEAQGATVDLVAEEATKAKRLSEELAQKSELLESIMEYHSTVLKALGDDRQAFDRLREWSKDESYSFRLQAEQAWKRVLDDHAQAMYKSNFTVPWKEGVDPSSLTLSQLVSQYWIELVQRKPALLEYIWRREDIPKAERLGFLVDVLRRDTSLKACEYAGRYFTEGAGLKIKPLAIDYLVDWWEKNKDQFTN